MIFKSVKNKFIKADKYTKYTIIVILIAIIIRLVIALNSYVTGDPCWYISVARYIVENGRIPLFEALGRPVFWPPPLFHFTAALFYKVFMVFGGGLSEFSIKLISPIFGSLTLIYTFLLTKKLYNTKIAFYAVLFLSFIPTHIYHSSIPYMATMVSFFVIASIYYLLEDKVFLSGIFAGLAISTKFTGFFFLPLALFIIFFSKNKGRIKKTIRFSLATIVFGSWWYIRNWIVLGNPLWPHLSAVFGNKAGSLVGTYSQLSPNILNLLNIKHYIKMYLAMFGVPAGNIQNLFLFKIPFLEILIIVWLVATVLFIIPFFIGIIKASIKEKRTVIILAWFIVFFLFALLNMVINNGVWFRHSLPFMSAIAIFWGIGLSKTIGKNKIKNIIVFTFIILLAVGFTGSEFVKAKVVSGLWSNYKDDFEWVKGNTNEDGMVLVPYGDCYAYNFKRFTKEYYNIPYVNTTQKIKREDISYIWINQYMGFYGGSNYSSAYPKTFLDDIEKNYKMIYQNTKTKTIIYEVR